MKKDWTEIVRDKMSESAVTPPDTLWDSISSELDKRLPLAQNSARSKSGLRWAVAASIAAIVGTGVYFSIKVPTTEQTPREMLAQNTTSLPPKAESQNEASSLKGKQAIETSQSLYEESSLEVEPFLKSNQSVPDQAKSNNLSSHPSSSHRQSSHSHSQASTTQTSTTQNPLNQSSTNAIQSVPNTNEVIGNVDRQLAENDDTEILYSSPNDGESEQLAFSPGKSQEETSAATLHNTDSQAIHSSSDYSREELGHEDFYTYLANYSEYADNSHKPNSRLSLGVYACNANLLSHNSDFSALASGGLDYNSPLINGDEDYDFLPGDPVEPSPNVYQLKGAKHRQPLRFGLSLRYPFSSSFSIGTGLVYSRLSSTLTWSNNRGITIETDQTLNYLGIPLSIEYRLPSYRMVGFYLTLGAMVEKCVYGQSKEPNSTISNKISEKPLQASVFGGAGVEFNLNRHIGIYVEPLAIYYFNNHSDVFNIYKDHKLSFDLRFGLRWNIK